MKREIHIDVGRYVVIAECRLQELSEKGARLGGDEFAIDSADLGRWELLAAIDVFANADKIEGPELKSARKTLALRQSELGTLLGVPPETVAGWEAGTRPIERQTRLAVLQLLESERGELSSIGIKYSLAAANAFSRLVDVRPNVIFSRGPVGSLGVQWVDTPDQESSHREIVQSCT